MPFPLKNLLLNYCTYIYLYNIILHTFVPCDAVISDAKFNFIQKDINFTKKNVEEAHYLNLK